MRTEDSIDTILWRSLVIPHIYHEKRKNRRDTHKASSYEEIQGNRRKKYVLCQVQHVICECCKADQQKVEKLNATQTKNKVFIVKGMGKSIPKVLSIGVYFQLKNYRVEVFTGSVKVLDEFEKEDDDSILSKRTVSSVEVRIIL